MAILGSIAGNVASTIVGVLTDWEQPNQGGGGGGSGGTLYDLTTLNGTAASVSASVNTSQTDMYQVFLKPDGTKVFFSGSGGSTVCQSTLSTPFDLTTMGTITNTGVLFPVGTGRAMWISPDGTDLIMSRDTAVASYALGTAWDVTTVGASRGSYAPAETVAIGCVSFSYDGTKMYITELGTVDTVWQYTCSTPFQPHTASYDSVSLNLATLIGNAAVRGFIATQHENQGLVICPNGTLVRLSLPTAKVLTGASVAESNTFTIAGAGGDIMLGVSETHIMVGKASTTDTLNMYTWGPH